MLCSRNARAVARNAPHPPAGASYRSNTGGPSGSWTTAVEAEGCSLMMVPVASVIMRAGLDLAGKGPVRISHVDQNDRDHYDRSDQQKTLAGRGRGGLPDRDGRRND